MRNINVLSAAFGVATAISSPSLAQHIYDKAPPADQHDFSSANYALKFETTYPNATFQITSSRKARDYKLPGLDRIGIESVEVQIRGNFEINDSNRFDVETSSAKVLKIRSPIENKDLDTNSRAALAVWPTAFMAAPKGPVSFDIATEVRGFTWEHDFSGATSIKMGIFAPEDRMDSVARMPFSRDVKDALAGTLFTPKSAGASITTRVLDHDFIQADIRGLAGSALRSDNLAGVLAIESSELPVFTMRGDRVGSAQNLDETNIGQVYGVDLNSTILLSKNFMFTSCRGVREGNGLTNNKPAKSSFGCASIQYKTKIEDTELTAMLGAGKEKLKRDYFGDPKKFSMTTLGGSVKLERADWALTAEYAQSHVRGTGEWNLDGKTGVLKLSLAKDFNENTWVSFDYTRRSGTVDSTIARGGISSYYRLPDEESFGAKVSLDF